MNYSALNFTQVSSHVGVLSINRPESLNALNATVINELAMAFENLSRKPEVRALVLTGSGTKAFVAGADIKEMQNYSVAEARAMADRGQSVLNQIERFPKPVIGAVNGFALGGGLELALACDFLIASKTAKFGLPEVSLGLIPGYGGTQRLARSVGKSIARRIALSGEIFPADAGERWGLFSELTEPGELMARAQAVAGVLAQRSPGAVALAKQAINRGFELDQDSGMTLEAEMFSQTFASNDHNEGIRAFIEKRPPQFQGN